MNIDLGRVTPIHRRAYSESTTYELNDIVLYTDGNLYWHAAEEPTTGVPPTGTTDDPVWALAFSGEDLREEMANDVTAAQAAQRAAELASQGTKNAEGAAAQYAGSAGVSAAAAAGSAADADAAKAGAETAQAGAKLARAEAEKLAYLTDARDGGTYSMAWGVDADGHPTLTLQEVTE